MLFQQKNMDNLKNVELSIAGMTPKEESPKRQQTKTSNTLKLTVSIFLCSPRFWFIRSRQKYIHCHSGPARYLQIFDVISEVNCVLLRTKRRFKNIALYPNFDVISEVDCVLLRSGRGSKKRSYVAQHAISELSTLYPK